MNINLNQSVFILTITVVSDFVVGARHWIIIGIQACQSSFHITLDYFARAIARNVIVCRTLDPGNPSPST